MRPLQRRVAWRTVSVAFTRRLLIGIIVVVLLCVLGNYLYNQRARKRNVSKFRPILSAEMALSAEGIEFFQNRNGNVAFKIRARQRLETRLGKNLLQGIEGYNYNPDGSVRSEIRSRSAEYDREGKSADFAGDVRIFFGPDIELRTASFHYDLERNVGTTRDPLQFYSREIKGTARGARFDQQKETLNLASAVDFSLTRKKIRPDGSVTTESLRATSQAARCSGLMHRIVFQGNVRLETETEMLSGDEVDVTVSADRRHVTSLASSGRAAYTSGNANERRALSGDKIIFSMNPSSGVLDKISVMGKAELSASAPTMEFELQGAEIIMELDAAGNRPVRIQGRTGVRLRMKRGLGHTSATGESLLVSFVPGTPRLESISINRNAKILIPGESGAADNELQAEAIYVTFRGGIADTVIEKLRAQGSAHWISMAPQTKGMPGSQRKMTASILDMYYSRSGAFWERGDAREGVVMSEISLESNGRIQTRRLFADYVQFGFHPGNNLIRSIQADGHVKMAFEEKSGAAKNSSIEEFNTESDKMNAFFEYRDGQPVLVSAAQWGNFSFRSSSTSARAGKCEYDAQTGILVLRESPAISDEMGETSGERVEYDQMRKMLWIHRRVRSKFSGKQWFGSFGSSSSSPVIILAEEMQYWKDSRNVRYTGKVQVLSENQQLQAEELEIMNGGDRWNGSGRINHYVFGPAVSRAVHREGSNIQKGYPSGSKDSANKPINILSSQMSYLRGSDTVTYSGNVRLYSADLTLSSERLEVRLDKERRAIERAMARVNVRINQAGKECKGEAADYHSNPGMFEITGNPAEIHDFGKGRSSARRLTTFTADDRILLDNPYSR